MKLVSVNPYNDEIVGECEENTKEEILKKSYFVSNIFFSIF